MPVGSVKEALERLGHAATQTPPRPVIHGPEGTLASFAVLNDQNVEWVALWVEPAGRPTVLSEGAPQGPAAFHGLSGVSAEVYDLLAEAGRSYLERTEELDAKLSRLQERSRNVRVEEVWSLQRELAAIRAHIGRALVVASECGGPLGRVLPGFSKALPSLLGELSRVQDVATNLRQALSDLVMLRDAEQSNQLAEMANALGRTSNRIAALANISNIRMLGITYVALVLAVISAVILFPNTGATILGMPSAAWVPGVWVDVVLLLLTVIPLGYVLSRRWVRNMFAGISQYDARVTEGLADLPEIAPSAAVRGEGDARPALTPPRA